MNNDTTGHGRDNRSIVCVADILRTTDIKNE